MSDDPSTVSISTLRQVFNEALDALQEHTGDTVQLDKDLHWTMPPEAQYDPYSTPDPDEFSLGDLTDSWQTLLNLHADGYKIPTYALVWIGQLLQALGHRAP